MPGHENISSGILSLLSHVKLSSLQKLAVTQTSCVPHEPKRDIEGDNELNTAFTIMRQTQVLLGSSKMFFWAKCCQGNYPLNPQLEAY